MKVGTDGRGSLYEDEEQSPVKSPVMNTDEVREINILDDQDFEDLDNQQVMSPIVLNARNSSSGESFFTETMVSFTPASLARNGSFEEKDTPPPKNRNSFEDIPEETEEEINRKKAMKLQAIEMQVIPKKTENEAKLFYLDTVGFNSQKINGEWP